MIFSQLQALRDVQLQRKDMEVDERLVLDLPWYPDRERLAPRGRTAPDPP